MDEKYKIIYNKFHKLKFHNINFQNYCFHLLKHFLESNKDLNLEDVYQYTKLVEATRDNEEYSIKVDDSYNAYEIMFLKNEIEYLLFCSSTTIFLRKKNSSLYLKKEEAKPEWLRLESYDALKTLPFLTFYINKLA